MWPNTFKNVLLIIPLALSLPPVAASLFSWRTDSHVCPAESNTSRSPSQTSFVCPETHTFKIHWFERRVPAARKCEVDLKNLFVGNRFLIKTETINFSDLLLVPYNQQSLAAMKNCWNETECSVMLTEACWCGKRPKMIWNFKTFHVFFPTKISPSFCNHDRPVILPQSLWNIVFPWMLRLLDAPVWLKNKILNQPKSHKTTKYLQSLTSVILLSMYLYRCPTGTWHYIWVMKWYPFFMFSVVYFILV